MSSSKMRPEELAAESKRIAALIRKASEPQMRGIEELSKRQFSLEEMRAAIERHHSQAAEMWGRVPDLEK